MVMRRGRISTWVATAVVATLIASGALFAQATTSATALDVSAGSTAGDSGKAAVIVIDGVIDNHTRDTFFRRFRAAEASGAKTIILKLNVTGGLASPALDISSFIRGQTGVRTIAFVQTQALSAGTVIGLACDELYMSPDARIGDAAPIATSSSAAGSSVAAAQSPILADFYASATTNGYDPLLTSAMVTFGRVVHYVQDESGDTKKFVGPTEYETLTKAGWRPVPGVPDPLDGADTVLTVDSRLAELIGLSKGTFASPQALAAARNLNVTTTYAPTAGDHLLAWLGTGFVRMVLINV